MRRVWCGWNAGEWAPGTLPGREKDVFGDTVGEGDDQHTIVPNHRL
jgi:hypothetical protein